MKKALAIGLFSLGVLATVAMAFRVEPEDLVNTVWPFSGPSAVTPETAWDVPAAPARSVPDAAAAAQNADPEWAVMVNNLTQMADAYRGRVGVYLKDLKTGREWAYHADDQFPSASLIKVPVMAAVFQKIEDGDLSLSQTVKLQRADRMGGSGKLKWTRSGTRIPIRELLVRMMRDSDNTALRMLVKTVGTQFIQNHMAGTQGLVVTQFHPEGLSLYSGHVRIENYTTAREMASLLQKMDDGAMVDRYASDLMLDLMKRNHHRARLKKTLPLGWEMAHKTGLLRHACHDVAVIDTPRGTFLMAVLTGQNRSYRTAKQFISRMGRATYAYYQGGYGEQSLVAMAPSRSRNSW